ncbi:hypothetical protein OW763_14140 [Clostridium aestuarii]|uniref:DUF3800 domain-containing protein n=1 Tax=Clostridium aestuarii TaxID=338193 RepID=A0ABT4D5J2_9CLOT|nr:hypothetical protein [Clostridium aestuarii]MCY6485470.1 hypothetical protein [Clostridium aestuarii]
MITICLDESGTFEDKKQRKFVGGLIYLKDDIDEERQRVEEFLINECKKLGLEYPQDIHTTEMSHDVKLKDKEQELVKNLKKYLKQNRGYAFTYSLKNEGDIVKLKNKGNIVNENNASNLYERMMTQLIFNNLFYNYNFKDEEKFNLNIATRVYTAKTKEAENEYEKLGYSFGTNNKGEKYFYLTNQQTYKVAIAQKVLESSIDKKLDINLKVENINYKNKDKKTTPILYLADFACNIIRQELKIYDRRYDYVKDVIQNNKILEDITGNKIYCWAYDEIDAQYNKFYKNFQDKNLVQVLEALYDIKHNSSDFKKLYSNSWYKPLSKKLKEIFEIENIDLYISKAKIYFDKANTSKYGYSKGIFIVEKLRILLAKENEEKEIKKEVLEKNMYFLNDLILRGYNHQGNVNKAEECYEMCKKYKNTVSVEEYINTINRYSIVCTNKFDFKRSIKILQENIEYLNLWKELMKEIAKEHDITNDNSYKLELRGKVLSSLAQSCAFNNNKEDALNSFKEALQEFKENDVQKNVTLSYFMHLAIYYKDLKLYKKNEQKYFNTDDLYEQFTRIKESKDSYKLFVYVKALNNLFYDKVSNSLIKELNDFDYKNNGFKINEHPWELIHKNLGILLYKKEKFKLAKKQFEKAVNCVKIKDITIDLINECTKIQSNLLDNDIETLAKSIKKFKIKCEKDTTIAIYFKDSFENTDVPKVANNIIKKFTYMYI